MGRGSSKAGVGRNKRSTAKAPAKPKSLKEMTDKEIENKYGKYQYHATTRRGYNGILNGGIKPSRGSIGVGVYLASSPEEARGYAEDTTGGNVILRVKTVKLARKYNWADAGDGESVAGKTISPSDIEVLGESTGEWTRLRRR